MSAPPSASQPMTMTRSQITDGDRFFLVITDVRPTCNEKSAGVRVVSKAGGVLKSGRLLTDDPRVRLAKPSDGPVAEACFLKMPDDAPELLPVLQSATEGT